MEQVVGGTLRVCIVADWKSRHRGCFWPEALGKLNKDGRASTNVTVCRLADRILKDEHSSTQQEYFLKDCDVLVINWDAINGDPDYGSNLALQWFEARCPELLIWVFHGGVLIIEGQAVMSIPVQKSYDAILGQSGLAVCGAEDELKPNLQRERVGKQCKMTPLAHKSKLFGDLLKLTSEDVSRTFEEMFPSQGEYAITPYLEEHPWNILYRGWFRWNPLRKKRLPWVSLIKTTGRKINHSTMMAAKHGDGAIFVSTMCLASSKQYLLIQALLKAHNKDSDLPSPRKYTLCLQRYFTKHVVPILAGLVAGFIVSGKLNPTSSSNLVLQDVTNMLLIISGGFIFWIAARIAGAVKKFIKEIIGC